MHRVAYLHKQAKGQTGPFLSCVTHFLPPFHQLLALHVNAPNKHLKNRDYFGRSNQQNR